MDNIDQIIHAYKKGVDDGKRCVNSVNNDRIQDAWNDGYNTVFDDQGKYRFPIPEGFSGILNRQLAIVAFQGALSEKNDLISFDEAAHEIDRMCRILGLIIV